MTVRARSGAASTECGDRDERRRRGGPGRRGGAGVDRRRRTRRLAAAGDGPGRDLGGGRVRIGHGLDPPGRVDLGRVELAPAVAPAALQERHPAQVVQLVDAAAGAEPVRDLDQGALGVAVQQQVGPGVDQDRAAHLVGPVVVVGDAAQAGLDAADDDGHVGEGLAAAVGVHDRAAVGPQAGHPVGRVGVVGANPALAGVAVHHRVHVAAGHAPHQVGSAERGEGVDVAPVGLGDDADPEAVRLEQAADQGHAERRVVDVGVPGHEDDVTAVPAQLVHLGPAGRQHRRHAEPVRPEAAMTEQRGGSLHGAIG
jgi:hypothetical protein